MQVLGNLIYELSVFKIMHKKMVRLAYKINAFAMSEQKRCMKGNTTQTRSNTLPVYRTHESKTTQKELSLLSPFTSKSFNVSVALF